MVWCLLLALTAGLTGCTAVQPEAQQPMYGQPGTARSPEQQRADKAFIQRAAASFSGSRERASTALWREGDGQMNQGNLDLAMKYYNQSWLLNPDNYQPFWGFGRLMLEQDKVDDSIRYFSMARDLCHDDYQRPALLSDAAAAYSYKADRMAPSDARRAQYFDRANQLFAESTRLAPEYANSWKQWAFSLYRAGDYGGAWEKVRKARALGAGRLNGFLDALAKKMPEPK